MTLSFVDVDASHLLHQRNEAICGMIAMISGSFLVRSFVSLFWQLIESLSFVPIDPPRSENKCIFMGAFFDQKYNQAADIKLGKKVTFTFFGLRLVIFGGSFNV